MARISGVSVTTVSVTEAQVLDGVTAGTVTASKAVVVDSSKQIDVLTATLGLQTLATARTATVAGATTGTVAAGTGYVTVTSADANHIIILPAPVIGHVIRLKNGSTGYELRTSAPATISINGGAEADAESAIAANTLVTCICVSSTAWLAFSQATTGALTATDVAAAA